MNLLGDAKNAEARAAYFFDSIMVVGIAGDVDIVIADQKEVVDRLAYFEWKEEQRARHLSKNACRQSRRHLHVTRERCPELSSGRRPGRLDGDGMSW